MLQFNCACGYQTDLDAQRTVSSHMGQCNKFKANSPLHQAFELQSLESSNIEALLIFRADLCFWVDNIRQLLEERGYIEKKQSVLCDYNQFSKPNDKPCNDVEKNISDNELNGDQPIVQAVNIKRHRKTGTKQGQKSKNKRTPDSQISKETNANAEFIKKFAITKDSESVGLDSLEDNPFNGLQDSFDLNMADFSNELKRSKKNGGVTKTDNSKNPPPAPTIDIKCAQCGRTKPTRSNQIYAMDCTHGMCQKCFVELYRGINPLKCPKPKCDFIFDKKFIVRSALNSDICTCIICDKPFQKDNNAKRHISSVHLGDVRKFCCDLCSKPFPRFSDIRAHKEIKHGIDRSITKLPDEVILLDSDTDEGD